MTPVSKVLGPFTLSVTDKGEGVFEGSVSLSATAGDGVVKLGGTLYADLNAEQVAALGFEEFNKILPAAAVPIAELAEGAVESEIQKL